MKLTIENDSPALIYLDEFVDTHQELSASLSYKDTGAQYLLTKFKKNPKMREWLSEEKYQARLEELQEAAKPKCLLLKTKEGRYYTYSGLGTYLSKKYRVPIDNQVEYPTPSSLPWANTPKFQMYPYQAESRDLLIQVKHGGVELATGLGKTLCLTNLIKDLGLKTLVMTPSTSISEQIYEQFVTAFGQKYVGRYYGSKKEAKKLIVIGNAQSLTRVEPDSKDWQFLNDSKVLCVDEAHTLAADTLAKVALGVASKAPYRFFFSATQFRNDGRDLLLESIVGPLVKHMSLREGVDGGYLAKPQFMMLETESDVQTSSTDPAVLTRKHLYYNPKVIEQISKVVNQSADKGLPILVLTEEVEQFTKLLPYLRHKAAYAHGPLNEENRQKVPAEYWESDPNDLVARFNALEFPVLVGTSCISTGTDVKAVKVLIYWQGGKSEIQVCQAIGRGTRLTPVKKSCAIFDIDITNVRIVHNHAMARSAIYDDLYGPVRRLRF
jgi:superfamily II DNA or RNA helicase